MPAKDHFHDIVRSSLEKVNKYKNIVKEVVMEVASMIPEEEGVELQLITDDAHGHYILASIGWINDYREFNSFLHIDVKPEGKVWIQHDGTDLKIALLLVERGIPKSDIVLGFQAPHRRKWIPDFAVE